MVIGPVEGSTSNLMRSLTRKSRALDPLPSVSASHNLSGGFAGFLGAPVTPIRERVPPVPSGYGEITNPQKRHLEEPRAKERPSGKYVPPEPVVMSPRSGGRVHIYPVSGVLKPYVTVVVPRKHRVPDPHSASGDLMLVRRSEEYDFKELYGCVKPYGALRQASQVNFYNPPPVDSTGRPIDYSLKVNGGVFSTRTVRPQPDALPEPVPTRASAEERRHGAVARAREAAMLRALNESRAGTGTGTGTGGLTLGAAPSSSGGSGGGGGGGIGFGASRSASTGTLGTPGPRLASSGSGFGVPASRGSGAAYAPSGGMDSRDATIATLQREIAKLKGAV